MKLIFDTKKGGGIVVLRLIRGKQFLDELNLTISQGFDTLLILAVDKILVRNRINRLSLKSIDISGKIDKKAVSGMVLETFMAGFKV